MTKKKMNENYYYNQKLIGPLKGELITRQSKVGPYRYGRYTSDYCGCSWIAQYNAQILLGDPHPPSVLIRWMENHSFFQGLFLSGLLGAYPWTVGDYFKNQGYTTWYKVGKKRIEKSKRDFRVGILFYLRKNFTGHYVAFGPGEKENQFVFINQEQGERAYSLSFQELWAKEPILLPVALFMK